MTWIKTIKGRLVLSSACGIALVTVILGGSAWLLVTTTGVSLVDRDLKLRAQGIAKAPLFGGPGPEGPRGPFGGPGRGMGLGMRGQGPGGPWRGQAPRQASPGPPSGPAETGMPPGQELPGDGPGGPPPDAPPATFEDLAAEDAIQAAITRPRIVSPDGKVLAPRGADGPWSRDLLRLSLTSGIVHGDATWGDRRLRVVSLPVRRDGEVEAVIQVAASLEGVELASQALARILLILTPLALLLSGTAAWLLVRSSLSPVDRATKEADDITQSGLFSRRLPVKGDDEISRLSYSMNALLDRLEGSLQQERALSGQLERSLTAQQRFTGDASHELRTPLTRISLAAENGLFAKSSDDKDRALLKIKQASVDMTKLVQDLLLLARADAGQAVLQMEELKTSHILREAVEGGPWSTDERLQVILPDLEPICLGDRMAINRILVNLLDNAVRHTPPQGTITLGAERTGDRCLLYVADTGQGMPPSQLARVGERFMRVEESRERSRGGAGLGLALCQELAEGMKATFTLRSEEGKGTIAVLGLLLP